MKSCLRVELDPLAGRVFEVPALIPSCVYWEGGGMMNFRKKNLFGVNVGVNQNAQNDEQHDFNFTSTLSFGLTPE